MKTNLYRGRVIDKPDLFTTSRSSVVGALRRRLEIHLDEDMWETIGMISQVIEVELRLNRFVIVPSSRGDTTDDLQNNTSVPN